MICNTIQYNIKFYQTKTEHNTIYDYFRQFHYLIGGKWFGSNTLNNKHNSRSYIYAQL